MTTDVTVMKNLDPSEYAPYFKQYIDQAGEGEIHDLLQKQKVKLISFYNGISAEDATTTHPPYTWTIAQVLGHLIDTEKILGCRAHRIACGDQTDLPGFDQDALVANYDYSKTETSDLVLEFEALRMTNQAFFRRLNPEAWLNQGNCDQNKMSVRALAFLMVGHANHHLEILKQRLA